MAALSSELHKGDRSTEIVSRAEDVSSGSLWKAEVLHETNVSADRQTGKVWPIVGVRHWYAEGGCKCLRSGEDN